MGIQQLFQLRYEDRRKVLIMGTVFFLAGVSEMINYTSFMAMFNSRVGTRFLPMMYLAEAFLLPIEGWLLSYFSQRIAKPKFMTGLYSLFIAIGLLNGAVLLICRYGQLEWTWFYVALFLTSNFVVRQQTLLMWSTAFDLCPTQQAKRVMPIFVLAAIVGGVIAGVVSNVFAARLGPELLYVLAAVILLAGLPSFIRSIKRYLLPLTFTQTDKNDVQEAASSSFYIKQTLRSPFLLTVIGIMTLMPAIYFLIEYQYFTTAQDVFSTEAELTSFYGLMVIILFCAALLLQLFAARLIDWLGASNTIFAIAIIFLGSLAFVSFFVESNIALVSVSIGYSLLYLLLYYFAEPGYQFFFKMLPLHQRDGFRYTAQSIAASVGILLGSGLSLLHSSAGISLTWQAVIGTVCAVLLVLLAWGARHLYIQELVRYLQVSSTVVKNFIEDFMESMGNERVRRAMIQQLNHPDELVQRFALEMFSNRPDASLNAPLWAYVRKSDGELRAMALAAIHMDGWKELQRAELDELLSDAHDEVRATAYRRWFATSGVGSSAILPEYVERARADESMLVQGEALKMMEESPLLYEELRRLLLEEGKEGALLACAIVSERRLKEMYMDMMLLLLSELPVVKLTAVRTMGTIGGSELVSSFVEMLVGADKELQLAIEAALIDIGDEVMPELVRFISSQHDAIWRTAIAVANATGTHQDLQQLVVPSCIHKLQSLSASYAVVSAIERTGALEWTELAGRRVEEITESVLDTVWTVMIRFGDERSIPQLRAAVESEDEEIRDHGLEILSEGLGNPKLNAALLFFYKHKTLTLGSSSHLKSIDGAEGELTDPWLQALSVKAGVAEGDDVLVNNWEYLSALDKIVFLRQVPLFQEISIEELGRVASIAQEKRFQEGDYLIRQGEAGQELTIIIEGHVELSGKNGDGTEGTIGIAGAKQTIGEAGLFDGSPSPVSAQVLFEDAKVLQIASEEVTRLVRLYPDIGIGLLRSISGRLRSLEQMLLKLG